MPKIFENIAGPWTLGDALDALRAFEAFTAPLGYHVALAGGVMLRGVSVNDLDVVVYPADASTHSPAAADAIAAALGVEFGLTQTASSDTMRAHWRAKGQNDVKHVESWRTRRGMRIDFVVVS